MRRVAFGRRVFVILIRLRRLDATSFEDVFGFGVEELGIGEVEPDLDFLVGVELLVGAHAADEGVFSRF